MNKLKEPRPLAKVIEAIINIIDNAEKIRTSDFSYDELKFRLKGVVKRTSFFPPEISDARSWETTADLIQGFAAGDDMVQMEIRGVFKGDIDYRLYIKINPLNI